MKKGLIIIIIILIVVIVVVPIYFVGINYIEKKECEKIIKSYDIIKIKVSYCMTLCPGKIKNSELKLWDADDSCSFYCNNNISERPDYEGIKKCRKKGITSSLNLEKGCDYSKGFVFPNCTRENIKKYSDLVDLSDFKLGEYFIYNLSVESLDCSKNPLELTLKLNSGSETEEVEFAVQPGATIYKGTINFGEIKTFYLEYEKTPEYISGVMTRNNHSSRVMGFKATCQ